MRGGTKFGVFDHMDSNGRSLKEQIEERLRLAEAYDRNGFHAYHLAEHHATPLGRAPSPSVYLAAIAQRTRRLRFGPLVYALALHHPLRVLEEICILDQMSGGRFELGSPNLDGGIKFAMVADREGEDVFNLLSSYIEPRKDALVAVLEAHVS